MTDAISAADRYPLGFVAAAIAPAAIVFLLFAFDGWPGTGVLGFVFALIVTGLHVGFIAVPLFALLNQRWPPIWWRVLPASFLVGAGPAALIGVASVEPDWAEMALAAGGFGLSGGIAFLLTVNRPWRRAPR